MITIREFGKEDTEGVIAFEKELRRQEPDTYFSQRLAVFGYELFHVGVVERLNVPPLIYTKLSAWIPSP